MSDVDRMVVEIHTLEEKLLESESKVLGLEQKANQCDIAYAGLKGRYDDDMEFYQKTLADLSEARKLIDALKIVNAHLTKENMRLEDMR